MISDAVILAAGKGTRLRGSADELPKPLSVVGGMPLIKRVILNLAKAGVTRVVVVTGFRADLVRGAVESDDTYARENVRVEFAHNADFDKANGISVIVGGAVVDGPFVLSMADHVYTPGIAKLMASQDLTQADLYLATDIRIHDQLDIDDATKVKSSDGKIVAINKALTDYDRIDCGVFAVTQNLVTRLEALRAERGDCSLSDGVRQLAERGRARIADIGDELWQDVDTPADREHAEKLLGRLVT